jgi:hypothetical protein
MPLRSIPQGPHPVSPARQLIPRAEQQRRSHALVSQVEASGVADARQHGH